MSPVQDAESVQESDEVSAGMVAGRICVGRITGAHGLKGELSVRSFTAEPDDVAAYGPVTLQPGGRQLSIRVVGRKKLDLIVRAEGVGDRTAAEALRGCDLYVARTAFPPPAEDEFYHVDLIGLDVFADGQAESGVSGSVRLGRIAAVHEFGAAPVLEVDLNGNPAHGARTVLVPFTREAVPVVDVDGGVVRVAPLPGLLEEGEPV